MIIDDFLKEKGYNYNGEFDGIKEYIKSLDYNINDSFYIQVKPNLNFMLGYNLDNGLTLKTGWNISLENERLYNSVVGTFIGTIEQLNEYDNY